MTERKTAIDKAIRDLEGCGIVNAKRVIETLVALVDNLSFISDPPEGYYQILNIYGREVNGTKQPVIVYDTEPES